MSDSPRVATLRAAPLLGGVALLVIYMRIGSVIGFQAGYGPPLPPRHHDVPISFVYVTGAEFRFWLAHLILAVPGALLIAWGLAPRLVPALRRLVARIDAASPRGWKLAALGLFAFLTLWSLAGHYLVLLDCPLTDDENAVTFGARILASGHLGVPILKPAGAFTDLFLFQHDGLVSSMDFPGVLLFGALAILTKLGPVLYALASATSGVAVAYAAGRWLGPRARVIAAALWIASPMIGALSITSHGQVVSRMFIALALAFAARLDTGAGTPRRDAILLGLVAGLGFLARPFETLCLLAPLGGWLTWRALARRAEPGVPRSTPLWMVGALVPVDRRVRAVQPGAHRRVVPAGAVRARRDRGQPFAAVHDVGPARDEPRLERADGRGVLPRRAGDRRGDRRARAAGRPRRWSSASACSAGSCCAWSTTTPASTPSGRSTCPRSPCCSW